jgi:uncharacterized protein DUF4389
VAGVPFESPAQPGMPGIPGDDRVPVRMAFAGPAPQRRLTVFFRILMMIPQLIVLYFVGIAAEVVLVIGWFAALFIGRLPGFAADFLAGYVRWQARVAAYGILLTDKYPPFALAHDDYPVQVAFSPGRLNRLAVLFRIFLVIPAAIVTGVLAYGAFTIVLFVTWLIVLVRGAMPPALYQAYAAVLRYSTRYYGYFFMLTAEYPGGLFGDRASTAYVPAGQPAPAPQPGTPGAPEASAYGIPAYPPPVSESAPPAGYGAPPAYGAEAPFGAPPAYGAEAPYGAQAYGYGAPPAAPGASQWQLILTNSARRLVGMFIGLGVVLLIAYVLLFALVIGGGAVNRAVALSEVNSAYSKFSASASSFASATAACQNSSQQLTCVTSADRTIAGSLGTFADAVRSIDMPAGTATTQANQLASVASQAQQALEQLGNSTSVSQYEQIVQSTHLQSLLSQLDRDYLALGRTLAGS